MRKQFFILLPIVMVPFVAIAQIDYRPLLNEEKTWNEHADAGTVMIVKRLYLKGDTVIEGENYKKLYEHTTYTRYDTPSNVETLQDKLLLPVMEKDQKVYAYYSFRKKLLYDFTLQPGDSLVLTENEWLRVNAIDTICVNGDLFRRFHLSHVFHISPDYLQPSEQPIAQDEALWVEGIGSDKGLTSLFGWFGTDVPYARTSTFDNCKENGRVIFTASDFKAPAMGGHDNGNKCAPPAIAYYNGRLVFSCETAGAECVYEIKCADAGSGRGNEVSLSGTYEIRVHATLDGWRDSDVATATIGWRNGRPVMEGFSSVTMDGGEGIGDVNGDGKVDVADIATVIDIMAGQTTE